MTDDPLQPLATAATTGDAGALEALARALQGPLYRLCLRILGRPEEAADAAQEALIQVVTHLGQHRGEGSVLAWAYAIAARRAIRGRRADRRRADLLAARIEAGLALAASSEPLAAVHPAEAAAVERDIRLGCTRAMLETLSADERAAIVLVEMLGADDALAAHLCGASGPTFRKRLSRARARLAPLLAQCSVATPGARCTCALQARARRLAGEPAERWPAADDATLEARERLGAVRALGPLLAGHPGVAEPSSLWAEVRRRLGPVLEGAAANDPA